MSLSNSNIRFNAGILIFLILFSCSDKPLFSYSEGLSKYIENMGVSLSQEDHFLIINLNSCNSCLQGVLESLSDSKVQMNIIVLAKENEFEAFGYVEKLRNKHLLFYDDLQTIYKYRTGAENLSYFKLKNGIVQDFIHINEMTKGDFHKVTRGF